MRSMPSSRPESSLKGSTVAVSTSEFRGLHPFPPPLSEAGDGGRPPLAAFQAPGHGALDTLDQHKLHRNSVHVGRHASPVSFQVPRASSELTRPGEGAQSTCHAGVLSNENLNKPAHPETSTTPTGAVVGTCCVIQRSSLVSQMPSRHSPRIRHHLIHALTLEQNHGSITILSSSFDLISAFVAQTCFRCLSVFTSLSGNTSRNCCRASIIMNLIATLLGITQVS